MFLGKFALYICIIFYILFIIFIERDIDEDESVQCLQQTISEQ